MSVKLSSTTAADPTLERGGAEQSLPFSPGIVYTTVANMEEAKTLAKELLQAKMAACVQMKGVISAYVWKDEVHEDPEVCMVAYWWLLSFYFKDAVAGARAQGAGDGCYCPRTAFLQLFCLNCVCRGISMHLSLTLAHY